MSHRSTALIILAVGVLVTPLWAQGTAADYERADSLARTVRGKVVHASIEPHWIGNGNRFWYRVDLAEGRRKFVLVDPDKAKKVPAFDHARLAAALSKMLGTTVAADRLPIDSLEFSNDVTIIISSGEKSFDLDLRSYDLKPHAAAAPASDAISPDQIRPSRDGGDDTEITFTNRSGGPVEILWIDASGGRQSYGTLADGASMSQHTFAGHSWLAVRPGGRPLAAFVAKQESTTAVIGSNPAAVAPRERQTLARLGASYTSLDGHWRIEIRNNNVVLQDTRSNQETQITKDGSADDRYEGRAWWSPDSRHFVVMKTIPAQEHKVYEVESSPKDQLQPKLRSFEYLKPGDRIAHPRLHLFDASGKDIPIKDDLFQNPWEITEVQWEPDSKRFTFLYNQRGHQVMRLIAVDAETGIASAVIDEQAKTFIDWTNHVYLHRIEPTHEAIWMSERDGWCHLYLYDTESGTVKNQITRGEWVVRGVDRVDEAKRQIWFRAGGIHPGQDPYYIHYCRVNFDGTGLTLLTAGDGTHKIVYSPDQKYIVDTWSRVDMPAVTEVRRAEDGAKVVALERGDASALLATGMRFPERFVAKGRDGKTDIYGVIVRPTNFDPAKKYPVIENIYAGPQGAFVPKAFSPMNNMQALAELRFIVVQMDGMGTNFRSKAFHDVCWKNLADAGFPDRILWIKAASAKYPQMDLTRVGIYGTSAGGQSALGGMLQHGDFYKACVSDSGCHDNRMDKIWWNEQWMGWPVGPEYAACSNVTMAPRLTGKLLLMVGEADTNVDPASTMQVVNALIKANKDFELLSVPGAGHGVAGTPYGRHRLRDFFVRTLLGVTPPDRNAPK